MSYPPIRRPGEPTSETQRAMNEWGFAHNELNRAKRIWARCRAHRRVRVAKQRLAAAVRGDLEGLALAAADRHAFSEGCTLRNALHPSILNELDQVREHLPDIVRSDVTVQDLRQTLEPLVRERRQLAHGPLTHVGPLADGKHCILLEDDTGKGSAIQEEGTLTRLAYEVDGTDGYVCNASVTDELRGLGVATRMYNEMAHRHPQVRVWWAQTLRHDGHQLREHLHATDPALWAWYLCPNQRTTCAGCHGSPRQSPQTPA